MTTCLAPAGGAGGRPVVRSGFLLALLALVLGGCLCPPSSDALLDVGYRSPEQTFRTVQTGVRAKKPLLVFTCTSLAFRRRNKVSQLTWLEFWDQVPSVMKTAIGKAKIESVETEGHRSRLIATSFGRTIAFDLVLEDFGQLYAGDEQVLDREIPFEEWIQLASSNGELWVSGGLPAPAGLDGHQVTELRLGREWKVDDFHEVDPDAETTTP